MKFSRGVSINPPPRWKIISFVIVFVFLLAGILTIEDYGLTFDEPENFLTGRHHLQFWLSGNRQFLDFEAWDKIYQKMEEPPVFYNELFKFGYRYPPCANTIAALTNLIFSEKLGLLDQISGYHLAILLFSGLTILFVYLWGGEKYGFWAGLAAAIFLGLSPYWLGHSHNNIKDIPGTALFTLTLWSFWRGIKLKKKNLSWLVAIFLSLTGATRPNAIFALAILFLWLAILEKRKQWPLKTSPVKFFLCFSILAGGTFFLAWPYLWQGMINKLIHVIGYLVFLGRGRPGFFFNRMMPYESFPWYYAAFYFLVKTPLLILLFGFWGMRKLIKDFQKGDITASLLLIWFWLTLIRVSLPKVIVYDEIRQFMEILPVFSIMAGIGFYETVLVLKKRTNFSLGLPLFLVCAGILVITNALLHPYQALYFNSLIAGIKGADKYLVVDIWGYSYKEGTAWLNQNLEKGARVMVPIASRLVRPYLRKDIQLFSEEYNDKKFLNQFKDGVYIMYFARKEYYFDKDSIVEYCEEELEPIYQIEVEGVQILKVFYYYEDADKS